MENIFIPDEHKLLILDAFLQDAAYTYRFDVTTGIIEHDIIDRNGYNFTKAAGLSSPCTFDEMIKRSFTGNFLNIEYTMETTVKELSSDFLRRSYYNGVKRVETHVRFPAKNVYHRLTYVMIPDNETGHIIAYVFAQDITRIEETKLGHILSANNRLQEALDKYEQADTDRRTDFLTGLRNRQDLSDMLEETVSRQHGVIKAMFLMDIDNFKLYNDTYGHTAGDECLKRIGEALLQYGEQKDVRFYRYGGEEILAISFSDRQPADEIAEEMVTLVHSLGIKREDTEAGVVTVSLGYTCDNTGYEQMIDKADSAMYRAKNSGKNQAVSFEAEENRDGCREN